MKKIILILSAIFVILIGSYVWHCNNAEVKNFSPFQPPDSIIIYNKGSISKIEKTDKKYSEITDLLLPWLNQVTNLKAVETTMDKYSENEIKNDEWAIEFIYKNTVIYNFYNELETLNIEYSRLLIPLSGHDKGLVFMGVEKKYHNGSFGTVSDEILSKIFRIL